MRSHIRILTAVFLCSFIFQACSSPNTKENASTQKTVDTIVAVKENFQSGQLLQLTEKSDPSQTYALYLPSGYVTEKKYPVIYFFDAHGDGSLPIKNYKELADKYGYIMAGSNNSKNGISWDESKQIADKLFNDVQTRVSYDAKRIYVSGFSGGARVANALAITNGSITGAICCGAAAPSANTENPRTDYFFMGIAGKKDFNYTEMRKYDMVDLAGYRIKHAFLTFNGKHEWPPVEIMDEAYWWMELNEMRRTPAYKNDSLVALRLEPLKKELASLKAKKQTFATYELCKKTINFYEGLSDVTPVIETWRSLQGNAEVDKALKAEEGIWKKEEQLKGTYMQSMQTQNADWWMKEIAGLNKKAAGKTEEALMYARILDYMSLVCYMQTTGALKQNNVPAADYFDKLYVTVDPTNSEAYYLAASIHTKQGNNKQALSDLAKAVKAGFSDKARLDKDSSFDSLRGMKEFGEVVERMVKKE